MLSYSVTYMNSVHNVGRRKTYVMWTKNVHNVGLLRTFCGIINVHNVG
jgi:hypothetical protein